jgi:hypothetical protein
MSLYEVAREVVSVLGSVLYARVEASKIVYYSDKECTERWAVGEDSKLAREVVERTPAYFTMNDGFTYTFSRIEWV